MIEWKEKFLTWDVEAKFCGISCCNTLLKLLTELRMCSRRVNSQGISVVKFITFNRYHTSFQNHRVKKWKVVIYPNIIVESYFHILLPGVSMWTINVCSYSVVSDSLWTHGLVACQAPLSMGFSKQEYWSGLSFPPPPLPDPRIEPMSLLSPTLADVSFTT